jgi:hypothetical protein
MSLRQSPSTATESRLLGAEAVSHAHMTEDALNRETNPSMMDVVRRSVPQARSAKRFRAGTKCPSPWRCKFAPPGPLMFERSDHRIDSSRISAKQQRSPAATSRLVVR